MTTVFHPSREEACLYAARQAQRSGVPHLVIYVAPRAAWACFPYATDHGCGWLLSTARVVGASGEEHPPAWDEESLGLWGGE